jgi:Ca2+-binding RTX toxin-like protein
MHRITPARLRGRTRRAVLAAALPAAIAAVVLPASAHAGAVSMSRDGANLFYNANSGAERNDVTVRANNATQLVITDSAGVTGDTNICSFPKPTEAVCEAPRETVHVFTLDGNDEVEYRAPHAGFVDLGFGDDVVVAGTRQVIDGTIRPVMYFDQGGRDIISYAAATRGVSLTPEDGQANDGRPGDRENVTPNFETIIGSDHADAPLFGTPGSDTMLGMGGDDAVAGGGGDDLFLNSAVRDGRDDYHGGPGHDTINYGARTQQLLIDLDNVADDGEAGENDNVRTNIESVIGGSAGDVITGDSGFDVLLGGPGADQLNGSGGDDLFMAGRVADGGDRIDGGQGKDAVFYGERRQPITATPDAGGRNDGETGEGDELLATETIMGGSAGDTIRAPQGSRVGYDFDGGDGIDRLDGADGPDTLDGGRGPDTLAALGESDTIFARDGESDVVGCGSGIDTAHLDPDDVDGGCEDLPVGVLRLAPKTVKADAGETARLRLSWLHPKAWKQLGRIELRLTRDGAPVGEITIRPRHGRMTADGAVDLVSKRTRLTAGGKTVSARLALRLDESLAGQTLKAEVEATDTRGRRQLERDAGTIRVAR